MAVVHQKSLEETFVVGKCYQCVDEVKHAIESYNKNNFAVLKNSQRSLHKQCTHISSKRRKSLPGTLPRSKQHNRDNNDDNNVIDNRKISNNNNSSNNIRNSNNYNYNSKTISNDLNSTTTVNTTSINNKNHRSSKKSRKHKMCHACNAYNKSQRCGDEALKLTKAYMSLLKELDNLENASLKGIDKELVRNLKQANAQLWQINSNLIKKKKSSKSTCNNSTINDNLSLDALEKFLGNLMIEAEEIEKESDLKDKDKYKMVMPVLIRIGKMVSHHPTKQFLSYHEHLGKLEKAIRVGQRNNEDNSSDSDKDLEIAAIGDSIKDIDSNIGSTSFLSDRVAESLRDLETQV